MINTLFLPFHLTLPALISHIKNTLGQTERMKVKLKYASMWQYIDLCDTTPDSHLQISLGNFPFEEWLEQPLSTNYLFAVGKIQPLSTAIFQ